MGCRSIAAMRLVMLVVKVEAKFGCTTSASGGVSQLARCDMMNIKLCCKLGNRVSGRIKRLTSGSGGEQFSSVLDAVLPSPKGDAM
jgi:hypothetical protein